mmetsp:Transcript_41318/g.47980  ORF Transcript_41318/g.47980 Transcript_41318/m.47980 type:complete len:190 (-) Transcript_41318:202-771(-)
MGLWAWTINQMLSPKFFKSFGKEGFIKTYMRGHKACRRSHDVGGRTDLVRCVGQDQFGNRYYEDFDVDHKWNRRWVEYSDHFIRIGIGGDRVPPGWHGWLSHMFDDIPEETNVFATHPHIKEHTGNLSGSPLFYFPKGTPQNFDWRMEFIESTRRRRTNEWEPPTDKKFEGKKLLTTKKPLFEDTVKDF